MAKPPPPRSVSAAGARRIAHEVVGEHIKHSVPDGHAGLPGRGTMESIIKRAKAKLASRGRR